MKYYYRTGVIEKNKKANLVLWVGFFVLLVLASYVGLLFVTLASNGWPFAPVDATAKAVKTSKPGSQGDRLFIPAINLNISTKTIETEGDPATGGVAIQAKESGVGFTPDSLRNAAPFFNLSMLKEGDEIFLDKGGVRYAYKIKAPTQESSSDQEGLTLRSKKVIKEAQAIGTVAWGNGISKLESL